MFVGGRGDVHTMNPNLFEEASESYSNSLWKMGPQLQNEKPQTENIKASMKTQGGCKSHVE